MKSPLGRVIRVYKGNDGFGRVIEIKKAHSVVIPSTHRLAPLPIEQLTQPDANQQKPGESISKDQPGAVHV